MRHPPAKLANSGSRVSPTRKAPGYLRFSEDSWNDRSRGIHHAAGLGVAAIDWYPWRPWRPLREAKERQISSRYGRNGRKGVEGLIPILSWRPWREGIHFRILLRLRCLVIWVIFCGEFELVGHERTQRTQSIVLSVIHVISCGQFVRPPVSERAERAEVGPNRLTRSPRRTPRKIPGNSIYPNLCDHCVRFKNCDSTALGSSAFRIAGFDDLPRPVDRQDFRS